MKEFLCPQTNQACITGGICETTTDNLRNKIVVERTQAETSHVRFLDTGTLNIGGLILGPTILSDIGLTVNKDETDEEIDPLNRQMINPSVREIGDTTEATIREVAKNSLPIPEGTQESDMPHDVFVAEGPTVCLRGTHARAQSIIKGAKVKTVVELLVAAKSGPRGVLKSQ